MARKKTPLSIQQHLLTSGFMDSIKQHLQGIQMLLFEHYPKSSDIVRRCEKTCCCVNDLISELDNILFSDNPEIVIEATSIYYPEKDIRVDFDNYCVAVKLAEELEKIAEIGKKNNKENELIQNKLIEYFNRYSTKVIKTAFESYIENQWMVEAEKQDKAEIETVD